MSEFLNQLCGCLVKLTGFVRSVPQFHRGWPPWHLELEPLGERLLLTGSWTGLTNLAPNGTGTMMLLSDGTVMVQGPDYSVTNVWYRLTPDASGNYVNGTWSTRAPMHVRRLYFGSNVLPDGRVFVAGGEYASDQSFSRSGEIYDPVSNAWTNITDFPESGFGDDPTEVLPDGRVLGGYFNGPQTYIYDPAANTWSPAGTKLRGDKSDEETWVKLPDNSILSYDIFATVATGVGHAQRYIPSSRTWVDAGTPPNNLSSVDVHDELGPAFLLPDGRVFFIGATGHTAYYTPSSNAWASGPDVPNGLGADDAPGAELPNGKILFAADRPLFQGPTSMFEFDPITNTYTNVTPSIPLLDLSQACYLDRMLVLPTGQVLFTTGYDQLALYTPDGTAVTTGMPTITSITPTGDGTFLLSGTLLNGISEGAAYGDDAEMSSNYPIVRLTRGDGTVYYARTHDWNATGVGATNGATSTRFDLPPGFPAGTYSLSVIANGISSPNVTFGPFHVATHYSVTASVQETTAGEPFSITVIAQDAYNNTVTRYTGTVHFSSSDHQATLPADMALTNGMGTFAATLRTVGSHFITATDAVNSSITGTQHPAIMVNPAAANRLLIDGPGVTPARQAHNFWVSAEDPFGNTDTNYQGTICLTSTDPGAIISPPAYTYTPADRGVHLFTVTLSTVDIQTVIGSDMAGRAGIRTVSVNPALFNPAVDYSLEFSPVSVASGQFTGSGALDLVTAGSDGAISVHLGNGDGTFQQPIAVLTDPNLYSLAVGTSATMASTIW